MYAAINDSKLATFNGGHLILFLNPKERQSFLDMVDEFLRQQPFRIYFITETTYQIYRSSFILLSKNFH